MYEVETQHYEEWFAGKDEILPEDVLEAEKQLVEQEGFMYLVDATTAARFVSAKVELDK